MATSYKRTKKRDQNFFDAISKGLGVTAAAKAAGYSRRAAYYYRDEDTEFKLNWEDAAQEYIEIMESEADRRAVKGIDEPVLYQGKKCGKIRKYSDSMLMFRLKGMAPKKYREQKEIDLKSTDGSMTPNRELKGDELKKELDKRGLKVQFADDES